MMKENARLKHDKKVNRKSMYGTHNVIRSTINLPLKNMQNMQKQDSQSPNTSFSGLNLPKK